MSVETICDKCGEEYDMRHGRCPACGHSRKGERKKRVAVRVQRVVEPLAKALAREAWSVLNHDNSFDGPEEWNTTNRKQLISRLSAVLQADRRKRLNDRTDARGT